MPRRKSTELKWKREGVGNYRSTNGKWVVQNDNGAWRLFTANGEEMATFSQKKPCQETAQEFESNPPKVEKTPPGKAPPPKRGAVIHEADTLSTESKRVRVTPQSAMEELQSRRLEVLIPKLPVPLEFEGARHLDSILSSFRLEVSRLTDMVGMVGAAILKLEEELGRQRKIK
jgi:hypothetical protein